MFIMREKKSLKSYALVFHSFCFKYVIILKVSVLHEIVQSFPRSSECKEWQALSCLFSHSPIAFRLYFRNVFLFFSRRKMSSRRT